MVGFGGSGYKDNKAEKIKNAPGKPISSKPSTRTKIPLTSSRVPTLIEGIFPNAVILALGFLGLVGPGGLPKPQKYVK